MEYVPSVLNFLLVVFIQGVMYTACYKLMQQRGRTDPQIESILWPITFAVYIYTKVKALCVKCVVFILNLVARKW